MSHPPEVVPVDGAVRPGRDVEDRVVLASTMLAFNAVNLKLNVNEVFL